jgi:hypothetical protein
MAREIATKYWCDLCRDLDRNVPATPAAVSLGDDVVLDLDLCEKHRRSVRAAVRKAVSSKRRHKKAPRGRRTGPFRCLVPGCQAAPLQHRSSFWQHLQINHDLTMDEYVAQHGEPIPLTAAEAAALVVEVRCDVDGCDQAYSTATGTRWPRQALVSHLRGRHGLKLMPDGRKVPI